MDANFQKVVKLGCKVIAQTRLADGRYFGKKVNESYTYLVQSEDGSFKAMKPDVITKDNTVIILKDGSRLPVSVPPEYNGWKVPSGFSCTVKNGRTAIDLKEYTAKEIEALAKE
jgi:hypothetical protein